MVEEILPPNKNKKQTKRHTGTPLHHRFTVSVGDSCELPPRQNERTRLSVATGKARNPSTLAVESPSPFLYRCLMQLVDVECAPTSCSSFFFYPLRLHSVVRCRSVRCAFRCTHAESNGKGEGRSKGAAYYYYIFFRGGESWSSTLFSIGKRTPPSSVHNTH